MFPADFNWMSKLRKAGSQVKKKINSGKLRFLLCFFHSSDDRSKNQNLIQ